MTPQTADIPADWIEGPTSSFAPASGMLVSRTTTAPSPSSRSHLTLTTPPIARSKSISTRSRPSTAMQQRTHMKTTAAAPRQQRELKPAFDALGLRCIAGIGVFSRGPLRLVNTADLRFEVKRPQQYTPDRVQRSSSFSFPTPWPIFSPAISCARPRRRAGFCAARGSPCRPTIFAI